MESLYSLFLYDYAVVEEKSKKDPSVLSFSIESFDDKYSDKIEKIKDKTSTIEVLNF